MVETVNPVIPEQPDNNADRWRLTPGLAFALVIFGCLWAVIAPELAHAWKSDKAMSHGPLVPLIAGGLIFSVHNQLKAWTKASVLGLLALIISLFLFLLAAWADVEFMKPLALVFAMGSAVWYVGGWKALNVLMGPLGFLIFMIPWPTSLTERLAFPLQITSSKYAAMLGGLMGLEVHREGVNLHVMGQNNLAPPIFSVTVTYACSGLTSFMVLMALTYLIAYYTPVKLGWRALMMLVILPLTLIANTVRLGIILLIGAEFNKNLAMWVHDNEGPFLIFFCSIALMGIRHWILTYIENRGKNPPPPEPPKPDLPLVISTEDPL